MYKRDVKEGYVKSFFFLVTRKFIKYSSGNRKAMSDFYSDGDALSRLNGSRGPGRQLTRYRAPP